jgi:hypothetical protein
MVLSPVDAVGSDVQPGQRGPDAVAYALSRPNLATKSPAFLAAGGSQEAG